MKKNVMFISSTGGHLNEMMQLKSLFKKYDYYIVTEKTKSNLSLKNKYKDKVSFLVFGTKDHMLTYPFKLLYNCFKSLFIYFKELILFEINQPLKFNNYLLESNNDYLKANSLAYSIINKINLFNILKYVLIVICDFIICFYNNNFSPFIYYLIINESVDDN